VRELVWSKYEIALFRRAANILSSEGVPTETDRGHTDEGDAWFVFCDPASGDVLGHFAKFQDMFVCCTPFRKDGLRSSRLLDSLNAFLRRLGAIHTSGRPGLLTRAEPILYCKSDKFGLQTAGALSRRAGHTVRSRNAARDNSA
jgi:hypothetical protein